MINVGVIGVGAMGYNHVRVLSQLKNTNLVAISDSNKETLNKVSKKFAVSKKYLSYRDLIRDNKLDAVIIAAPNHAHKKIAVYCIKKGIDVLVEKPISHSVSEGRKMLRAAKRYDRILMVGHIERFNPVVINVKEFMRKDKLGPIYLINTVRAGPYPKRLRNIGVLIDLAVHDVDIIKYLVGDIKKIYSQLILFKKQAIYCKSLFTLSGNVRGSSEFSWVSPKRTRTIQIYGVKGILEGDYQNQTLKFYDNPEARTTPKANDYHKQILMLENISSGKVIDYAIKKEEPLKLELEHFLDCVKYRKKPLISVNDAINAVEIAFLMLKSGKEGKPVFVE